MNNDEKIYPGRELCSIDEYQLGTSGVFQKKNKIYASISGQIQINTATHPPTISVVNKDSRVLSLKVETIVYAKILNIIRTQCICEIFATKEKTIKPIQGIIKHENIKMDYKEFDIFDCFVPGDIIIAKVISIDESNFVYLSVAEPNLGVIFAKSHLSGDIMIPVSWEQMESLETHQREKRKVAKPDYV